MHPQCLSWPVSKGADAFTNASAGSISVSRDQSPGFSVLALLAPCPRVSTFRKRSGLAARRSQQGSGGCRTCPLGPPDACLGQACSAGAAKQTFADVGGPDAPSLAWTFAMPQFRG